MTNNNIYELPKTATISYFDVETDQNLTFEEWKHLHQNNSSEIKVISKSGADFISEKEGYGPCSKCSNSSTFELEIILKNSRNGWRSKKVYDIGGASEAASQISRGTGHWKSDDRASFTSEERSSLVSQINEAIDEHINQNKNINRVVENDFESDDGGKSCSGVIM